MRIACRSPLPLRFGADTALASPKNVVSDAYVADISGRPWVAQLSARLSARGNELSHGMYLCQKEFLENVWKAQVCLL